MTDADDKLARRYRELAREEPPGVVDEAILAASRRAVGSRPRRRWAMPVSIAAVMVLGIGVALRMQVEQPGIETSVPMTAEYPVPQSAPEAAAPAPESPIVKPTPDAIAEAPPSKALSARTAPPAPKRAAPPAEKPAAARALPQERAEPKAFPQAPAAPSIAQAPPAVLRAPSAAQVPSPEAFEPPPSAPMTQAPPAAALRSEAAEEARAAARADANARPGLGGLRAKREGFADSAAPQRLAKSTTAALEAELERIAKLRAEGRHAEADKALEEFRRQHPDYRIPEAMWERVKPAPR